MPPEKVAAVPVIGEKLTSTREHTMERERIFPNLVVLQGAQGQSRQTSGSFLETR